jgi:hypothetical protein
MNISDIINAKKIVQTTCDVDRVELTQSLFQETEPYFIIKNILDENIYTWNKNFIDKVLLSFSSTVVQSFSKKEKDLFDRYRSFLIYGINTVIDEDVQRLDEYIGKLGIIGVNI